jgi:hypothetical protein
MAVQVPELKKKTDISLIRGTYIGKTDYIKCRPAGWREVRRRFCALQRRMSMENGLKDLVKRNPLMVLSLEKRYVWAAV